MSPAKRSSGSSDPAQEPDSTQPAPASEPETGAGPLADLVSSDVPQPSDSSISDPVHQMFEELAADMPSEEASPAPTLGPKAQAKADGIIATAKPAEKRGFRPLLFVGAFVGAVVLVLLLAAGAAYGLTQAYTGKVVPGVKVGSLDVSGLDRAQVMAKLATEFAGLGGGKVTISTPIGTTTVTYAEMGRAPDTEAMADAALSVGHSGNFLGNASVMVRTAFSGQVVPVVVKMDPTAIAKKLRALVGTTTVAPKNASVTVAAGKFTVTPSSKGRGIDEVAVASSIIAKLAGPDAPAALQADAAFVDLAPQFNDQDAAAAVAAASKMAVNVTLTWGGAFPLVVATPTPDPTAAPSGAVGDSPSPSAGGTGSPSPVATSVASPTTLVSPTPTSSPIPKQTFTIPAATIHGWILFDWRFDGTYGPIVDPAAIHKYLDGISAKVRIKAVEPKVLTDSAGKPVGLASGANGADIDYDATIAAIQDYLSGLARGSASGTGAPIVMRAVEPTINSVDKLDAMVVIGSWTTTFYPDETNGFGTNIRLPASLLNGQVVAPGQEFSFFNAVGPIDPAHGWTYGGVIVGGKSDHTGAMGGGICSASTTMFNAAARAGLKIDERHAHFYYINRYPAGLDATVYSNGVTLWDLKWTNDTPYPIVIRGYSTGRSTSHVTFELWSLPVNRTVTFNGQPAAKFTGGLKANLVKAGDGTEYVSTLAPGQKVRAEYPTDGFETSVTRVVTDSTGATIWQETWNSHYGMVNGLLLIGAPPATAPPATPPPSAAVIDRNSVLGRRRKRGLLTDEELAG